MPDALLEVENLDVRFRAHGHQVSAVRGVSLSIAPGEVLGLVGESGCGKTSLSRAILGLVPIHSGSLRFRSRPLAWSRADQALRVEMQMVFQDPYASLNPRMTVWRALKEPLVVHRPARFPRHDERVLEIMDLCGIARSWALKYPHEFSGGQRQRIAIARALVLGPEFVIADEPVSSLDVSIQAMILNLLLDLRAAFNLTLLFITHDLSVVRYLADRVAVMRQGQILECGPTDLILRNPQSAYTRGLIDAIPQVPGRR